MTDVLTGLPPAAWYPDPARDDLLRWWDGSEWSTHTMARPDEAPAVEATAAPPAPPVTSASPSAPDLPPVLHTVTQSIPDPMPFATGVALGTDGSELRGSEPPMLSPIERAARAEIYAKLASSHAKESAPETVARGTTSPATFSNSSLGNWDSLANPSDIMFEGPLPASTVSGWLLALSPWLGVGALGFQTFQLLNHVGGTSTPVIAVYVLAAILPFFFAGLDRARLGRIGHTRRPSWWWMLLGPLVYFIARTVALSRRSRLAFLPLVVWVANVALASIAMILLLPGFIQGMVETEVEKQLAEESANQGVTEIMGTSFDVRCPDGVLFPPFTCHISSDSGLQMDVDVAIVDGTLKYTVDESTFVTPNAS